MKRFFLLCLSATVVATLPLVYLFAPWLYIITGMIGIMFLIHRIMPIIYKDEYQLLCNKIAETMEKFRMANLMIGKRTKIAD